MHNLCTTCKGVYQEQRCVKLMLDHVHYVNILAQPSFFLSLLQPLEDLIVSHHNRFRQLYLLPQEANVFINIHLGMHWKEDIENFGMPIYFSTMHYEPKHKQLNIIKQHQTNNKNHGRDILQQEIIRQFSQRITPTLFKSAKPIKVKKDKVDLKPTVELECKQYLGFFNLNPAKELRYVPKFKQDEYKYCADMDVLVQCGDSLRIARLEQCLAYIIKGVPAKCLAHITWYAGTVPKKSLERYTLIPGIIQLH